MQVKRSGFVFSLYKKNMINLWILAGILLLVFISMIWKSGSYLMNYLFYRAEPDPAALTAFLEQDILDVASVCADIEAHGGEAALIRSGDSMFFRDNVYQEGDRYRFSLPMDETLLTDTGVYYDDTCKAYYAAGRTLRIRSPGRITARRTCISMITMGRRSCWSRTLRRNWS